MSPEPLAKEPWMLTVTCKGCGAQIRFPVNRGKLRVRCPWCQAWFVFSWHPANLWDLVKRKLSGLAPRLPISQKWDIKSTMTAIFIAAALVVAAMQVCAGGRSRPDVPERPSATTL